MEKVTARVERETGEKNFSCYMKVESLNIGVLGQGSTAGAAIADMLRGWEDTRADLQDDGIEPPAIDIAYTFDIGADMAKKILVTVERGEDGTYSCYSETPIGDYALVDGDGKTVQEAKADFLRAVEECRAAHPGDERYEGLSFEYNS